MSEYYEIRVDDLYFDGRALTSWTLWSLSIKLIRSHWRDVCVNNVAGIISKIYNQL